MNYYRKPLFEPLEKVVENGETLTEFEAVELIQLLANGLKRKMLIDKEKCVLEDGRKRWMVRYSKYERIRLQNRELKKENTRLREAVLKLSL